MSLKAIKDYLYPLRRRGGVVGSVFAPNVRDTMRSCFIHRRSIHPAANAELGVLRPGGNKGGVDRHWSP